MINIIKESDNQTDVEQLLNYINGYVILKDVNKDDFQLQKKLILRSLEDSISYLEKCAIMNPYEDLDKELVIKNAKDHIKRNIKKIIKKLTSWYMKKIERQQNQFNQQVVMTLRNQLDIIKYLMENADKS